MHTTGLDRAEHLPWSTGTPNSHPGCPRIPGHSNRYQLRILPNAGGAIWTNYPVAEDHAVPR
jgi:hypothetical protein